MYLCNKKNWPSMAFDISRQLNCGSVVIVQRFPPGGLLY
jgi:hypothetical protein